MPDCEQKGKGTVLRILFRLLVSTRSQSTAEFFVSRQFEIEFAPLPERMCAVVRVAPYVVGDFGEAFVWLEGEHKVANGTQVSLWVRGVRVAEGAVTDTEDTNSKPRSDSPDV